MIISKERYLRAEKYHAKFEINFEPEKLWPNGTVDLNVLTIVRENELYHEAKERELVDTHPDPVVTESKLVDTSPELVDTKHGKYKDAEARKARMREYQAKRRAK